jgi:hypothetical protein
VWPAEAGLKINMRIEMSSSAGGVGAAVIPPGGGPAAGSLTTMPAGPTEMVWMIQDGVLRSETVAASPSAPEATVTLWKTGDQRTYVLNPRDKTYFTIDQTSAANGPFGAMAQGAVVTAKPTGEVQTFLGHKAEKIDLDVTLPIKLPPGMQVPPGVPAQLHLRGEIWSTDDFGSKPEYAVILEQIQRLPGAAGAELARTVKFPLQGTISLLDLMPMSTTFRVTEITEQEMPKENFVVPPAGYREVSGPPRDAPVRR